MAQSLAERVSLAMMWGWPDAATRGRVIEAMQGARFLSDLPDDIQKLIIGWEKAPRYRGLGRPSIVLAEQLREAREQG